MIVGTPIYARSWILRKWYSHLLIAARNAEVHDLAFVFVVDETDDETISCIEQTIRLPTKIVKVPQKNARDDHQWDNDRYHEMVYLRNILLQTVRACDPDLFLSLDSDVLLHPQALRNMLETIQDFDAVGGKTYMTEVGPYAPSYAMIGQSGVLVRPDCHGVVPVECIMAIKLMKKEAFWVDYGFHHHGEDIFWSLECRKKNLSLAWDGRVTSKHVMNRDKLTEIDERCGF